VKTTSSFHSSLTTDLDNVVIVDVLLQRVSCSSWFIEVAVTSD